MFNSEESKGKWLPIDIHSLSKLYKLPLLCQKVASCKHLSNFPLEKVNSRPRWMFGRQVAPPFSRETSFTSCRYSPSPHFGKSSPKHRIHLPSQRLPQSISSPAELIYSPSTEENQRLWPAHREGSGYLSPDKENRPYLQLIDKGTVAFNRLNS